MKDEINEDGGWFWKIFPVLFIVMFVGALSWFCLIAYNLVKVSHIALNCEHPSIVLHDDGQGNKSYSLSCDRK